VIRTGTGDCQFHDALANDEHTVAMYVARGEPFLTNYSHSSTFVSLIAMARVDICRLGNQTGTQGRLLDWARHPALGPPRLQQSVRTGQGSHKAAGSDFRVPDDEEA
jgi:hypothetical protein